MGIILAKQINQLCGGTVVAPWNVLELPEEWLDVFTALQVDLPAIKAGMQKVEAELEKWRSSHKNL